MRHVSHIITAIRDRDWAGTGRNFFLRRIEEEGAEAETLILRDVRQKSIEVIMTDPHFLPTGDAMKAITPPPSAALALLGVLTLTPVAPNGGIHGADARACSTDATSGCIGADCSLGPRVRSSRPYLRAMIDEAALRSPRFRRLASRCSALFR
jgi:hypothetical protein